MRTKHLLLSTGLVATAVLLAACSTSGSGAGGGSASTSASTSSSPSSANVAASAVAAVAEYSKTPTKIKIAGPLSKTPPRGKTIAYLKCPVSNCDIQFGEAQKAAAVLGWTVKAFTFGQTPESVQAAFTQALNSKPDGILTSGWPRSVLAQGLAQAQAEGIPVVDLADSNEASPPIIADVDNATPEYSASGPALYGRIQADWIAVHSNGKANVVLFDTPDYPYQKVQAENTEQELKKVCPGCKLQYVPLALTDLGPQTPTIIVSKLQQDPSINYVVLAFTDLYDLGVGPALKSAGLTNKVTLVSSGPGPTGIQDIASGKIQMAVSSSNLGNVWCVFDAFARHFVGDPVPEAGCTGSTPIILTQSNTSASWKSVWPGVPGFRQQFATAWHVG